MTKLQNPEALNDLKLSSQLPSSMKAEKFVMGEKYIVWWKEVQPVTPQCWEHMSVPMQEVFQGSKDWCRRWVLYRTCLEICEWTPDTLWQYPNLSCCQVLCHPEGDSGNLEGRRFQHLLTSANLTSEAAPTFSPQKFLVHLPTLAPFASFLQWEEYYSVVREWVDKSKKNIKMDDVNN